MPHEIMYCLPMATRIDITLDCAHAPTMGAFWKLALGYEDEPPPAPFATGADWMTSLGLPPDDWDKGAWLRDPDGVGPRLSILEVPEPKTAKNRLHIDVRVSAGVPAEQRWLRILETVAVLTEAGACELEVFDEHHVVMADPEGNEFCVC
jgi:hypothetical protein